MVRSTTLERKEEATEIPVDTRFRGLLQTTSGKDKI